MFICEHWCSQPTPTDLHKTSWQQTNFQLVARRRGRRRNLTETAMASLGLQILGVALAVIGWLGNILICALPLWRVSAFIGNNIVVAQSIWEGLWMSCVVQSTGQMQCKVYDSLLALPPDLQAARAMIVISILFSFFGLLLSVVGGKCTTCIEDETAKARVCISAGIFFLLSGALCLVTVSLPANAIIKDFYNPLIPDAQRRELGACLYVGWGAAGLLLIGGALLCCQCPSGREHYNGVKYTAPKSTTPGKEFV
ncbi:claudin 29 isoform X3 [Poecilia latipinna]|uniref:claudin 29 isoform X3 n=1 Tax=Poecilia latipinna TaxID=48699 RepID=UPI00072EE354|nr:PREDICTED: claudin-like protein ZF-A89 isoform X3 [Poecilia latipinna]